MIEPRITSIRFYYKSSPRKAEEGDVKMKRGKVYVRQQAMSQGCYCVRGSRPVWEWVPEDQARSSYRSGWVQPARKKGKAQP